MPRSRFPLWSLLLLALPLGPAAADTLVTTHGRVLELRKAREEGDMYRLEFEAGVVLCPKEHVASVEIEGDMSDYVPKDERERDFLEQGYVRYAGKWMSKPAYEVELRRRAEERRERTAELAAHASFADGWTLETRRFVFRTNTSPELLTYYSDLLEAYYALMDDVIGIDPTPSMRRTKMQVNVYKSQAELIRYANDPEIDDSVLGYFWAGGKSLNFYHDWKDPELSTATALHECTHLLTYLIDQEFWPPIWINEGVADYYGYSGVEVDERGKVRIEPGETKLAEVFTVQSAAREGRHVPLADLFLVEPQDFDGFHYSHAWSFVYFLEHTPRYQKPFRRFFKDLYGLDLKRVDVETLDDYDGKTGVVKRYSPEQVRDALLKALKVKELGELEEEWLAFVDAVEVDGPLARFERGYSAMVYGSGTAEQALEDLDVAIAAGIDDPRAYWTRALAKVGLDDWQGAVVDIRRATELAPLDPLYRAELAWALSGWWGEGELVGTPEELDEGLVQLGLAAELDPKNAEYADLLEKYRALHAAR